MMLAEMRLCPRHLLHIRKLQAASWVFNECGDGEVGMQLRWILNVALLSWTVRPHHRRTLAVR